MLEHLFGSKTRLKLLKTFFREPERSFFVRELTRIMGVQINAVRRELKLLISADIIKEVDAPIDMKISKAGATLRKYYLLNDESILYPELQALLLKGQILGEQEFVKELKDKSGDVKMFLLTGRFTNELNAFSDILLVGNLKERTVAKLIDQYEKEFGFDIRYTTMTEQEFYDRQHVMDKFLFSMFEGKYILVVDGLMKRK